MLVQRGGGTMDRRSFLGTGVAALAASAAALPRFAVGQGTGRTVLRFVPSSNLTVLDPVWSGAYVSICHGYAVFDALYGTDAAQRVRPQMAEGHTVSDDGRTWSIRLRDGLRFHDGEPVRAQDCAASLARWAARVSTGQVVGAYVEAWSAADDRTIRVSLKRPLPTLATLLATSVYPPFMMPERLARTDPSRQVSEMVGSGPFRFLDKEYVSGSLVAYERFDGYRPRQERAEWTAGGKVARVDRIEWRIIPDAATAAGALQNGEVDWLERPVADLLPVLKARREIALDVIDPTGWTGFLRFNHLQPPFNNEGVRRAVMAAINQEDFLRVAAGGDPSSYTVCKSVFPCAAGDQAGSQATSQPGAAAMPGDPAAAKAMLRAAGYAGEKAVLLASTDVPPLGEFAELVADTMRRIGMEVELAVSDWGTVTQRRTKKDSVAQGGWSAFVSSANGPAILNPAVNFLVRGQGERGYFGWYGNDQVEALARDWLEAGTEEERRRLEDAIQAVAFRTVPYVPLGQWVQRTAYRRTVQGVLQGPAVLPWNVGKG